MIYNRIPEVTIITPVYNGKKYINDIFKCLSEQTFTNYEWIIIDDCSSDGTLEILSKLAETDHRVKLFPLAKNGGPIKARNYGLDNARGRFIAFLDFDDLWVPDKLEKQLSFMKANNLALSYTGYRKISDEGRLKWGLPVSVPKRVTYKKLIVSNSIMASSAVFDRSKTGDIRQNEDAPLSKDDLLFWLSILEKYDEGMGLKEALCRLRVHNHSITNNKILMAKRHWHFYRKTMGYPVLKSLGLFIGYGVKGLCKYLLS